MKKGVVLRKATYYSLALILSIILSFVFMIGLNKLDIASITGYTMIVGNITINITTTVHVNVSITNIDFGVGTVNGNECIIDTQAGTATGCSGFSIPNLTIESLGNVNSALTINITLGHTLFLGTSNGNFSYTASNSTEPGSCQDWSLTPGAFTEITNPVEEGGICNNFTSGDNNIIDMDFKLVIPAGIPNSTKTNNMTVRLAYADLNMATIKRLNITLCINELSTLNRTNLADRTINTSELFTLDVNATNETILPVVFSDNLPIFAINSTTGLINFTPVYNVTNVYSVNISLDTGVCPGLEDSAVFTLTVQCKNHFPLLEVPDLTFTEDTLTVIDISQYVTDAEGTPLRYNYQTELSVIPTGDDSHLLVYEPPNSEVGVYTMKVTAIESLSPPAGCGSALANSTNITVTVTNVNDYPYFPYFVQTWTVEFDKELRQNITARDIDPNEYITFWSNTSWFVMNTSKMATVNNNATSIVNFTLNRTYLNQTFVVLVSVNDTSNAVNSTEIFVTVVEKNYPPNITSHSPESLNRTINEGGTINFTITKNDTNMGGLTTNWYLDNSLQKTKIDTYPYSMESFVQDFDYNSAGNHTIRVEVTDGNLTDSLTWNVTVNDVTLPPSGGGGGVGVTGGPGTICIEKWGCTDWLPCSALGIQKRECVDVNKCGTIRTKPNETAICTYTGIPTCNDRVKNGDEEGIDCGGTKCKPCPSCFDSIRNQGEEETDCGGPCEQKCVYYPQITTLEKCGDGVADPEEVFSCLNDSWSFWVMMPLLFFLITKIGMVLRVSGMVTKKQKRGIVFSVMKKAGIVKSKKEIRK